MWHPEIFGLENVCTGSFVLGDDIGWGGASSTIFILALILPGNICGPHKFEYFAGY